MQTVGITCNFSVLSTKVTTSKGLSRESEIVVQFHPLNAAWTETLFKLHLFIDPVLGYPLQASQKKEDYLHLLIQS